MMKTIHIDFAPRSISRTILRTSFLSWAVIAIGCIVCVSTIFSMRLIKQEQSTIQLKLRKLETQLSDQTKHQSAKKEIAIPQAQAIAINTAVAQLNLPWADVFDAIESATSPAVALLSMEPDAKKHLFKIVAETKNSENMIAYIEQLKRQKFFIDVTLSKHEIMEQDPNKPIRFQFSVQWDEVTQ